MPARRTVEMKPVHLVSLPPAPVSIIADEIPLPNEYVDPTWAKDLVK